jgi:hypothetical protein
MNIESPMMLFYATGGGKYCKASLPESQDDPETGTLWMGVPETGPSLLLRGPKLGALQRSSVKRRHPTQACEAAGQVRSGAVHAWRRTAQPQLRAAYSWLSSENRSGIW